MLPSPAFSKFTRFAILNLSVIATGCRSKLAVNNTDAVMDQSSRQVRIRFRTLLALLTVTIFTFAVKFYPGPGYQFVNDWGPASVGYEVFFMLLVFLVVPHRSAIAPITISFCLATCALEFLQLWRPPWLQSLRSTFPGKGLLGDTCSWWDLPTNPFACLLGWYLLRWLDSLTSDS